MTLTSHKTAPYLLAERLSQIPTQFGKLLYVANSFDSKTGRYRHEGLQLTHDQAQVHEAFAIAHQVQWQAWLDFSIRRQHADLLAFSTGLNRRQLARDWMLLDPWPNIAPREAPQHERDLFASDFRSVLVALKKP